MPVKEEERRYAAVDWIQMALDSCKEGLIAM
jgi:hypothetical protein